MTCPSSAANGCRCEEHYAGPLAVQPRATIIRLPAARTANICHGYANCCRCPACLERAARHSQPADIRTIRQPWDPRPARHAA